MIECPCLFTLSSFWCRPLYPWSWRVSAVYHFGSRYLSIFHTFFLLQWEWTVIWSCYRWVKAWCSGDWSPSCWFLWSCAGTRTLPRPKDVHVYRDLRWIIWSISPPPRSPPSTASSPREGCAIWAGEGWLRSIFWSSRSMRWRTRRCCASMVRVNMIISTIHVIMGCIMGLISSPRNRSCSPYCP